MGGRARGARACRCSSSRSWLQRPIAALLTGFGPRRRARRGRGRAAADGARRRRASSTPGSPRARSRRSTTTSPRRSAYIAASVVGLALHPRARSTRTGSTRSRWGWRSTAVVAVALPDRGARRVALEREAMPRGAMRPSGAPLGQRLVVAAQSVALPLALQAVYLVCLPFAAREGVGAVTSFGYAYLAASAVVAVTASSLGLVTSVPLARIGLDPSGVARHVVSSSWLALVAVGRAAGVFALAGERRWSAAVLGDGILRRRRRRARAARRAALAVDGLRGRVLGDVAAPLRAVADAGARCSSRSRSSCSTCRSPGRGRSSPVSPGSHRARSHDRWSCSR